MGGGHSKKQKRKNKKKKSNDAIEGDVSISGPFTLLLLGCGMQGKTTFLKHFRNIPFLGPNHEWDFYVGIAKENLIDYIKAVHTIMEGNGISLTAEASRQCMEYINSLDHSFGSGFTDVSDKFAQVVTTLSADLGFLEGVKASITLSENGSMVDPYWLRRLGAIQGGVDSLTLRDFLTCYIKTTGMYRQTPDTPMLTFLRDYGELVQVLHPQQGVHPGEVQQWAEANAFEVMDTGGQRSERKKWRHALGPNQYVCFVARVDDYAEVLYEDWKDRRLEESLRCWEMVLEHFVVESADFSQPDVFLFLNGTDNFESKFGDGSSLGEIFKDYTGGASLLHALSFITSLFIQAFYHRIAKLSPACPKRLHVYHTCALDSDLLPRLAAHVLYTVAASSVLRTREEFSSAIFVNGKGYCTAEDMALSPLVPPFNITEYPPFSVYLAHASFAKETQLCEEVSFLRYFTSNPFEQLENTGVCSDPV